MATKTATTTTRKKTTSKTTTKKAAPKKAAPKKAPRANAGAARAKSAAKSKTTKPTTTKPAKASKAAKPKRVSLLDAAATVLASAKKPMTAKAIVEQVTSKGMWTSGKGKTPHATLYAAMIREIAKKQTDARFKKVDRGLFTAA